MNLKIRSQRLCILTLLLAPGLVTSAAAQDSLFPEGVLEVLRHRAGRWEGRNEVLGPDGKVIRVESEDHDASLVLNNAIVEIHGFIEEVEDFRAYLLFNPRSGTYSYSTIDRTNNHLDLTAPLGDPYRYTSTPITRPDGGTLTFRLVFDVVEPDRMEGYGEISVDGGATWRRIYNQYLRRVR